MKISGIEMVIHRGVMRRRSEDTKYSHFAGKAEDLKLTTLMSWFDARFKKSIWAGSVDTYIVSVNPDNFFAMRGARLVHDRPDQLFEPRWEKKRAARAEVIVRVVGRSETGAVTKLEIIDIQAYPADPPARTAEVRSAV